MLLLIGELSNKTGVSIRSIRYYEKKGLILPERLENGYRQYHIADVERVKTIQLFLDLGLRTDEISPILSCESSIPGNEIIKCAPEAISLYEAKLQNTQQQIETLKETESKLKDVLSFWRKVEMQTKG